MIVYGAKLLVQGNSRGLTVVEGVSFAEMKRRVDSILSGFEISSEEEGPTYLRIEVFSMERTRRKYEP